MAHTTRKILPARPNTWTTEFAARLKRGLVSVPKRPADDANHDEVWGQHRKATEKRLRNRTARRKANRATTVAED